MKPAMTDDHRLVCAVSRRCLWHLEQPLRSESRPPENDAAQYVRMSTEHQRYSTTYQIAAIGECAAARGIRVVKTHVDEAKTGPGPRRLERAAAGRNRRHARLRDHPRLRHHKIGGDFRTWMRAPITNFCTEKREFRSATAPNLFRTTARR